MDKNTIDYVARLDTSKIDSDVKKLEQQLSQKEIKLKTTLDVSEAQKGMNELKKNADSLQKLMTSLIGTIQSIPKSYTRLSDISKDFA